MFLAPAFLFGLLAIGMPLWLHRVTRAHPTQQPFASHMFLEASESQRTARHTIRYWLLLLLRVALVAALAFAFAGPLATERMLSPVTANAQLHAIIVDGSYSMQYGDRWSRALAAANEVLDQLDGADRVMLVRAAGRRIEVVHEAVTASNAGSVRAALRDLTPSLERLDYGLAMSTAESWLGSPRPPATLHFISDLQQSGAPLRFAELEPPPNAELVMHAIGEEAAANAYIDRAEFVAGDARKLQASIRHIGAQPERRDLILLVDGKEHGRQTVELPASVQPRSQFFSGEGGGAVSADQQSFSPAASATPAAAHASFGNLTLAPGSHRIELRIEPQDRLPEDDHYFAVIEHADPRALLISRSENADDAAYFEAALGSLDAPKLAVETRSGAALPSAESLAGYSLAVISDASALSSAAARRVLEYVEAGGAVLATLGEQRESGESPLLPDWRIGEMRSQAARVGEISTSHPALREASDWRRVRFFRQRSVQPGENDKVLVALEGGAPLLIERTLGAGRMLVLTSPIERSWSDLAIHPLFVHFIADAGRYLTGADASAVSHTAGSVVMTGLTAATGGQIFDPAGERVLSLAEAREAERLIPSLTGFYEIRGGAAARWLAVNVDARESDLAPLPQDFVHRWQALRIKTPAGAAQRALAASAEPRSLGPLLMWVAALVLLAELLMANRYLAIRRT